MKNVIIHQSPYYFLNTSQSNGFVITLESTAIILSIVASAIALTAGFVQTVSKFNEIGEKIRNLSSAIATNSQALQELKELHIQVLGIDKKIDLHIADNANRNQNLITEINRQNLQISNLDSEVRQLENYLQRETSFKIREQQPR